MASLIIGAMPAIKAFGFPFIWTEAWNPVTERFGALASVYGTLVTSFLAMLLAVPTGIGIAIFLTEICPRPLRRPIGIAIELLAGIPSIIYGIWGPLHLRALVPGTRPDLDRRPARRCALPPDPVRRAALRHRHVHGRADPFDHDPALHLLGDARRVRDRAAHAQGSGLWPGLHDLGSDVARGAALRAHRRRRRRHAGARPRPRRDHGGDLRDRNDHHIHQSLFAPATTISATIANEFTEAIGDLYLPSLIELGLILFFITFVVLASAQLMLRALERRAGSAS
ncbi:MAG: hypothetical protein WDM81_00050 [Rhizomicrobium sp.]